VILSDVAIRNRTTVGVLIVLILVFGTYSYITLPRESSPDVPIPYILVTTTYEGVSPEDIESSVTIKIEKELAGLKGVKEITSASAEGASTIVIEFLPDVEIDNAMQYVRDKVELARDELPEDAEEPVLTEINVADFPIMMINISGDISPVRLKMIADDLEEVIESIPGVLNCDVLGALEREIRIEVDQDKLAVYGLTVPEIISLIPAENVNISAGGLETPGTKFNVRVPAEFVEPDEVNELVIATRNGRPIYLTDVAEVRDTFKDRVGFSRLDGTESITVTVQKRLGENIVHIADAVKAVLHEFRQHVPQAVHFDITLDQSKDIHMMISDLENNLLSGLILVTAILLLVLGWRAALIVAFAIPVSMLLSVTVLQLRGYTLNMIVLFGLIMALGMLVDNAIVIVENIYRHYQQSGRRLEAARRGTAEVAWPVITSTATTVAAFAPLIFWPGIMGAFMKWLPITLSITLISSLFVAIVVSPTVASRFVSARGRDGSSEGRIVRTYRRVLETALQHRFTTLLLSVLLLVGVGLYYARHGYGVELFPDFDPYRGSVSIRFPQGTNIYQTDRLTREIESRLAPYAADLEHVITNVGTGGGGDPFSGGGVGGHLSSVTLTFHDYEDRPRPSAQAIADVRHALADIAGAEIKVQKQEEGPPTGAAVTVRIVGEDFKKLEEISDQARQLIANVPGLVNLRSDHEAARPELAFQVDRRRAMLFGVNTAIVGNFLKTAVFGSKVGTYRQFNDEYDITVRLPVEQRENIDDLFRLHVPNAAGAAIPLSSLGKFTYTGGYGTIRRINQKRVVTLTADAEGRLSTAVLADVQRRLDPLGITEFSSADFSDLPAFCKTLADSASSSTPTVARRVWERLDRGFWPAIKAGFGHGIQALLRDYVANRARTEGLEPEANADLASTIAQRNPVAEQGREIVAAFNQLLGDPELYESQAFAGTALTEEAQRYLGRGLEHLSSRELRRFNRVLLESAFPGYVNQSQRIELPPGYQIRYAGEKEEQDEAQAFLSKAFVIALFLIVLILVAQFNTLKVPLIIMTTVILSLIGVLIGLLVCRMPFGIIMTGVGVISLAGVVVNNAIVLLDYTRLLEQRGLTLIDAAIQAGATRLRPVLLTAITTILGLIPMAVGISYDFHNMVWVTKSESSQWWSSMAIAVIFGLAFATLLTLVVLPTLYVSLSRLGERLGFASVAAQDEEEEPATGRRTAP
jgi:multidrug efflux pump